MMKKLTIGGQAVIEGVLMRSPNYYSISVRKPDGRIVSRTRKHVSLLKKCAFCRLPFIRGIFVLLDSLLLGVRAILYSSDAATDSKERMSIKELIFTLLLSTVLALAVFKLLPLLLANLFSKGVGGGNLAFNIVEGIVKFLIFLLYLYAISNMKDVAVMFQYHGAEHKSVNAYESGKKLTPRTVKRFTTLQLRCGTSFIFMVILVSMLVYLLVPIGTGFWLKYALRLALLPLISGLSYEAIRLSSKHPTNPVLRIISAPGLLIQRITTSEPDTKQLEVAIAALKNVLKKERVAC